MKYGEFWLVDFCGAVGHEYQKFRPALIIQSDGQLKITNVTTIIPLTSMIDKKHEDDILIKKNNKNNLFHDSILKVHHIQTFDKLRFVNKIGIADNDELNKIKDYIKKHFDI